MSETATAGPALERSVLLRKERDELATIAQALGMKPAARAGKATLIDQILREAGLEAAGPEPGADAKPKRGRPKKVKEEPAIEGSTVEAPAPVVTAPESRSTGARSAPVVAGTQDAPEGKIAGDPTAPEDEPRPRSSGAARRAQPVSGATLFDPFAGLDEPATASSGFDDVEAILAERANADTPRGNRDDRATAGAASQNGDVGHGLAQERDRERPRQDRLDRPGDRPDRTDRQDRTDRHDRAGGERPGGDRQDRASGERPGGGERPSGDRQDRQDRPGGERPGDRQDRPDRQDRQDRPGGDRHDRQPRHQGDRQDRGRQFGNERGFGGGFDDDGGRSKRRRRRGAQRERISPERDAQADRLSESYEGELIDVAGLLDLADQGYGYIRADGYLPGPRDVYVPVNRVRQLGLRRGDRIVGAHRPATPQEKFPAIVRIDSVNGLHPEVARLRPKFEDLTPLFPDERLKLEMPGESGNMVARIVELVSPIGKGQRGLIVSPPKAGKTTIMKQIAHSIEANNPEVHLMVLLVDERPEEVTDMRRSVRGEVIASTFDRPADEHTIVAELAIERAKRLVEERKDVVIILDGITRLSRAYNLAAPATGRIMSGGIDTGALYPPKKFFGSARNVEEGGSLTILATALIETGSVMDNVIFEEFKGTGNMELRLDRRLAEKRVYPAINVNESSTRHEELLYDKKALEAIWKLRRVLNGLAEGGSGAAGLELLMDRIKTTRTNVEFLAEIAKAPSVGG